MEKNLTDGQPDMIRESVPGRDSVPERDPFAVCAITYLVRPQNLPPFYNAALSLTKSGIQVHAFGTVGRVGVKPHEEIAPGFTFSRIELHSRVFFHNIPGRLGDNILTAGLQYLASYVEYNVKMFIRARQCPADIVEAHDLPSLFCARLIAWHKRCPIVYHAHELWSEMGPHVRFRGFWRWLEKRLIRGIDLIVTPEENRARIYREEYGAPELPLVIANCPP
ncbi:glycosyltransferase, partial [Candidatus Methylomirabilis sp.]|uniref:glycosyltransferase n=1 Tax=Candidatus Methylomirabilis sp. TaxID=2032687 RepID=UPI003C782C7E